MLFGLQVDASNGPVCSPTGSKASWSRSSALTVGTQQVIGCAASTWPHPNPAATAATWPL